MNPVRPLYTLGYWAQLYILGDWTSFFSFLSRRLYLAVFYVRHLSADNVPSKFTAMRVLFSLVALIAGAQALSNPLKRGGGSDVCSNTGCPVSFANPVTGKSTDFGTYSEMTPT